MEWIQTYWKDILAIYGGIVAVCTTIVKLTPTTKDDEVLHKILKVIDCFSTAFMKSDEEKLKDKSE